MENDKIALKNGSRILFVLPTLGDRPSLVEKALKSVASQKPYPSDIYIVTPTINKVMKDLAKRYKAELVKDPGGGISKAVNEGIRNAKPNHEFVGWMGDDDLLREGSLKATFEALEHNNKAVLAFGYCDYIDEKGNLIFTSKAGSIAPWLMTWGPNLVPLPGILFKIKELNEVGRFSESLRYAMDLDALLKLRKLGKFINTKKTLAAFRWHPDSTTVDNRQKSLAEAKEVKRKHMGKLIRVFAPTWEWAVDLATKHAAKRVNKSTKNNLSSK